ncbi:hypothetical protein [Streptomyces sp. NPDC058382]
MDGAFVVCSPPRLGGRDQQHRVRHLLADALRTPLDGERLVHVQ